MAKVRLTLFAILFCLIPFDAQAQSGLFSVQSGAWNDPATWSSGISPMVGDAVSISQGDVVTLTADSSIAGLVIHTGGELRYSPSRSVTLSTTQSVVVYGRLTMRPSNSTVSHSLRFVGINEANYQGAGMTPKLSDVGLWVMCVIDLPDPDNGVMCAANSPGGQLDILGAIKVAWTRAAGGIALGASQVILAAQPVGWQVGDEISIVPTEGTAVGSPSWSGFEVKTITAIQGAIITLNTPTTRAHPANPDPNGGKVYTAEILNLTRNVRIEGTLSGRTHVFIRSSVPQSIRYAALRYLGPRMPSGGYTSDIAARFGLHFHHDGDGSRGSLVEGVVVRDSGAHAFVPHGSNGITLKDTISYNTFDEAYWWNPPEGGNNKPDINDTTDLTITHAIAAIVRVDPSFRGQSLAGFLLRQGPDGTLALLDSVAVGVQGNKDAAGYSWPEFGHAVWRFDGNVAHNNKVDGTLVWQNTAFANDIVNFVSYNNGGAGLDHGAYGNTYQYHNIHAWGNAPDFRSRASSTKVTRPDGYGQALEGLQLGGVFAIAEHNMPYAAPTLVKDCIVGRVNVNEVSKPEPGQYDFVNCVKLDGSSLEAKDFMFVFAYPTSRYRVQRKDGTAYQLMGDGSVTTIAPFYASAPEAIQPTPTATATATTLPLQGMPTATPTLTPTPMLTPMLTPTFTPMLTPTFTPVPLSELAQTVAWILQTYPHVRQELEAAGVIP